jgi:tetratricopeptide (TPR) repeat protein
MQNLTDIPHTAESECELSLNVSTDFHVQPKYFLWSVAAILLLTIVVYANSINNDFTNWDDPALVIENRAIRSLSLENILHIFTPHPGLTYQPVRLLSYAIDYHFWRLNPVGYHIGNTLLHSLSSIILYLLLLNVLNKISDSSYRESGNNIALLAALLFVVHPVNVESVSWISSRKYGLVAFFTFLSFYLYVKSGNRDKHYILQYLLSILTYILALLSSPFGVVLPGLIILYEFCRNYEINSVYNLKHRLYYYIPYILITIIHFIFLFSVVFAGPNSAVKKHSAEKYIYTLFTMLRVLCDYIKNIFFPFWLNNRYIDRISLSFFEYKVIISLVILIFIAIILLKHLKSRKTIVVFCVGWFFISLLPVSNIVPISTKMADRYLYLPAIGILLLFSVGLHKLAENCFSGKFRGIIVWSVAIPLVFIFSYLSIQRNKVWANSQTLWEDSLKKAPQNHLAHLNLGEAMYKDGRLDEAIKHYFHATRLKPDYADAYNNLATALAEQGKFKEALDHYEEALRIKPHNAGIHNNLASFLAQQGKVDQAIAHFSRAFEIRPDFAEVYSNLGNVFRQQGNMDKAIAHYSKALEIKPHHAEAHNNLGVLLAKQGRLKEATIHYSEALRLNPDSAEANNNLAVALVELGEIDAALPHYAKALDLQPDYTEAYSNLGNALAEQGKLKEAVASFTRALEIRPNYPGAHNNLGVALTKLGKLNEAIGHFNEALRLKPDYAEARTNLGIALELAGRTDEAGIIRTNP